MVKKIIIKSTAFLACFCLLFSGAQNLLCRKETEGTWNSTSKIAGFYNAPENEFDVIFFGSSNTYCSFNPLVLWEEKRVKSYVFATQNQPLWATYYYMKDAFKRQKPKIAVLDALMLTKHREYYDDGVNYSFADDMPFSVNKLRLVNAAVPIEDRFDLLFNFTKYHSRWNELTEKDYTFQRGDEQDDLRGYVFLEETFPGAVQHDVSGVITTADLYEKNVEYFEKIVALCREEGVPLMLVKTPNNKTTAQEAHYRVIRELAVQSGLQFIDYNEFYSEIGLDLSTDFYDKSHLNYKGAEKFTRYFARSLGFSPSEDYTGTAEEWDKDLAQYKAYISNLP